MPGPGSGSTAGTIVGALVAAIAVIGSVFLGWDYGGFDDPVAVVIGVAVVALLVYRQYG